LLSLGFRYIRVEFTSFYVLYCVGFLVNLVMASSLCPIMNVHDICFNEEVLLNFVGHDSSNIGNVQLVQEGGEHEILEVVDVERHDDAYIIKMRLENLQKQRFI